MEKSSGALGANDYWHAAIVVNRKGSIGDIICHVDPACLMVLKLEGEPFETVGLLESTLRQRNYKCCVCKRGLLDVDISQGDI